MSPSAGFVGRPHGLDGSFYVERARASLLAVGTPVTLGGEPTTIVRRAGTDARPIVRVATAVTRDAAAALRRSELIVEGTAVPALGPEEWWAEELEGCRVVDGARVLGTVRRLLALPSCECLEVERGDAAAALLVPLVRDAIRSVDVDARCIDVDGAFLGESS